MYLAQSSNKPSVDSNGVQLNSSSAGPNVSAATTASEMKDKNSFIQSCSSSFAEPSTLMGQTSSMQGILSIYIFNYYFDYLLLCGVSGFIIINLIAFISSVRYFRLFDFRLVRLSNHFHVTIECFVIVVFQFLINMILR